MPWEGNTNKRRGPSRRQGFLFEVYANDAGRLHLMLDETKRRKLWEPIFGATAFTVDDRLNA